MFKGPTQAGRAGAGGWQRLGRLELGRSLIANELLKLPVTIQPTVRHGDIGVGCQRFHILPVQVGGVLLNREHCLRRAYLFFARETPPFLSDTDKFACICRP